MCSVAQSMVTFILMLVVAVSEAIEVNVNAYVKVPTTDVSGSVHFTT
jgi:hypothetical protein